MSRSLSRPIVVSVPYALPDPHQWCVVVEITNFGDTERRYLDHRCDECREYWDGHGCLCGDQCDECAPDDEEVGR